MSTSTQAYHPYHLVDPSPWPIFASLSAFASALGAALYMHRFASGSYLLMLGLGMVIYSMIVWWRDVLRESTFEGHHTSKVQSGLRLGMILFILSEVMLFFSLFWAFFHSSLSPSVDIGAIWPPFGITPIHPWGIPFLNTVLLLSSGAAVTYAHHAILAEMKTQAIYALVITIILAVIFSGLQAFEYIEAPFSISDGIYGSTFYLATGFHGAHVIIGTIYLLVCLVLLLRHHFTSTHHFAFEAAAWYFHFVDVVWLFLFVSMYWWNSP